MTCVVVMALGNQPEAFPSDLGDDQSRYLFCNCLLFEGILDDLSLLGPRTCYMQHFEELVSVGAQSTTRCSEVVPLKQCVC